MRTDESRRTLRCGKHLLTLDRVLMMGVLNVTPDSFSDGGRYLDAGKAIARGRQLIADGADILDIGGESTRPGSDPVSEEEELRRVEPVIEGLLADAQAPLSIDTCKPAVARRCLDLGVTMLNDVTALRQPEMIEIAASHDVPVILMHMLGEPKTMQDDISYDDVAAEVKAYLGERAREAASRGVGQIIVDPGIGFGKTTQHNLILLQRLREFKELPYPLLIGVSRKSFIGSMTGAEPGDRLGGTLAATTAAILNGADIVRVHDVAECRQAVRIAEGIRSA